MITLIIGAVCLAVAGIYYYIVMRGLCNPNQPAWASGTMCAQVHCVVITSLGGGGAIFVLGGLYKFLTVSQ